ncbi:FGGY-family carbohydrate kinase [Corynebacterium sp. CCM 9186]|uniref:rhamnulokinase n=1 Tax=Corynebacterium meridianum TaxID=2765363 RepID=UPI0020032151|nr:FGGY-family carbohydrate kinase [Corynebacterium meridianum]MCK7677408.1 FGGY-family carbohydrate kinase [Corynebacterium meridianum]
MSPSQYAAVALDLGSSNGRAIVGVLNGGTLKMQEAHRFPHKVDTVDGALAWDIDRLLDGAIAGITIARTRVPIAIDSIGVDSWGVDYALVKKDGQVALPVRSYRDTRMAEHREKFNEALPAERAFALTGIQPADINTANQLFADLRQHPELVDSVERVQLLPDYFASLLCGEQAHGRAISSTTGLATPGAATWSEEVLDALGIPRLWFSDISRDSMVLCPETITGIPMVRPGGHDTACAVHAIPHDEVSAEESVFISCGSWTLVGACTDEPVLSDACFTSGFTNEVRIDGGIRLLKNITGLWILQDCMRAWQQSGKNTDLPALLVSAESAPSMKMVFDPNDEVFTTPGDMPAKIHARMRELYGREPESTGQLIRLILESLAIAHATAISEVTDLTGTRPKVVNIVGGGSRNGLLCQMTASATGLPVLSGPAEASAAGNLLSQFEAIGAIEPGERDGIIQRSFTPLRFEPRDPTRWNDMRRRLAEVR